MEYSSATHVKSYGGANRVSYISPLFLTPWFHLNQAEPSDPVHVYLNIELLLAELRGRPLGLPHFQQLATNNIF